MWKRPSGIYTLPQRCAKTICSGGFLPACRRSAGSADKPREQAQNEHHQSAPAEPHKCCAQMGGGTQRDAETAADGKPGSNAHGALGNQHKADAGKRPGCGSAADEPLLRQFGRSGIPPAWADGLRPWLLALRILLSSFLGYAFASASGFRKAASPASDTWTHFGSGEASAS